MVEAVEADGVAALDRHALAAPKAARTPQLTMLVQAFTALGGGIGMPVLGCQTPHLPRVLYPPPRLLVQMLVHRPWTSRPVTGTVSPVMRIDGRAALTLSEAARWLGLTVPCVSALIARGELPSLRDPDGGVRISAAALIEWAGSAGRGGPPSTPK